MNANDPAAAFLCHYGKMIKNIGDLDMLRVALALVGSKAKIKGL